MSCWSLQQAMLGIRESSAAVEALSVDSFYWQQDST